MQKDWYKNPAIVPIFLVCVGIFLFIAQTFFVSEKLILGGKIFSLEGKNFSILAPQNSEEFIPDPSQSIVSFGRGSKNIPLVIVGLLPTPPPQYSLDCKELKKDIILVAHIDFIKKNVDVCEDPMGVGVPKDVEAQGYKMLGTSGFRGDDNQKDKFYLIEIVIKESFLNTAEGMEKAKQIVESFTVKP